MGSTYTPLKADLGLLEICLNYRMLTRVGSTCTTSYISRIILPSSCLLCQTGGSTSTLLQIELLVIFIFSGNSKQ